MADLKEYKCPCCGGGISFDSRVQKMKCPYCDTEFDVEAFEEYDQECQNNKEDDIKWDFRPNSSWQEGEAESLCTYVCESCGGEIVCDANTAAAFCPYCDNPVIMTGRLSGALRPDYVIPFKLDKNAAKEGLKRHLTGLKLLPKVFKSENHIDEIRGIYVPFWLFDADADADVRYKGKKVSGWSDANYNYLKTSYFSVLRSGRIGFERIPVDGSSKIADDLMESIEPYDFSEAVDFQTAYLSGYLADKYDVDAERSVQRANDRVRDSVRSEFAKTVTDHYASLDVEYSNIRLLNGKAKYALYPVWLLNTSWRGRKYTFAMNGQTGKFVGDLPIDKKARNLWFLGLAALFGIAVYGAMWLLAVL